MTNISHQFLLPTPRNSDTTSSLASTEHTAPLFFTRRTRKLGLASEDRASNGRVFNFDIGMTECLAFPVQEYMNSLHRLLKPLNDLRRGYVL